MDTQQAISTIQGWSTLPPQSPFMKWATEYYGDRYSWHRWWALAQLTPDQREKMWQLEITRGGIIMPADIMNAYGLKFDNGTLGNVPHWKYQIGHYISEAPLSKDNLDFENFQVLDRYLLQKSI